MLSSMDTHELRVRAIELLTTAYETTAQSGVTDAEALLALMKPVLSFGPITVDVSVNRDGEAPVRKTQTVEVDGFMGDAATVIIHLVFAFVRLAQEAESASSLDVSSFLHQFARLS